MTACRGLAHSRCYSAACYMSALALVPQSLQFRLRLPQPASAARLSAISSTSRTGEIGASLIHMPKGSRAFLTAEMVAPATFDAKRAGGHVVVGKQVPPANITGLQFIGRPPGRPSLAPYQCLPTPRTSIQRHCPSATPVRSRPWSLVLGYRA